MLSIVELTVACEDGERKDVTSLLDISASLSSWEAIEVSVPRSYRIEVHSRSGFARSRNRCRNNFATVNKFITAVSDNGEFSHGCLEVSGHLLLLVDLFLPEASGTWVTSEQEIRLETHFTLVFTTVLRERRLDFTRVSSDSWETGTLEKDFKEHLSVKLITELK